MKKLIADVNPGDVIRTYHGEKWLVKSIERDSTNPLVTINGSMMFDKHERVDVVRSVANGNHL